MSSTTPNELASGREAAIACLSSARDFWLSASTDQFLAAVERNLNDSVKRYDYGQAAQELRAALERWSTNAGGRVLEHVEAVVAARRESVEACGSTFATAWEAARHCVQVPLRIMEGDLLEHVRHDLDDVFGTDYDALVARVKAEYAMAAAGLGDAKPEAEPAGEDEEVPALTGCDQATLAAMATLDASILATIPQIIDAMPVGAKFTEKPVGASVRRLIELDMAERPEGDKGGARLASKGRRLARKIP